MGPQLYRFWVLCCLFSIVQGQGTEADGKTFWMQNAQQTLQDVLARQTNERVAKNVILFIGDGMGVSTVTAARIYKGQQSGQSGEETQLNFDKFPHVGLSKTYAVNKQTSGSASTATAILCGVKANYATVGVDSRVPRGSCEAMQNSDYYTDSILHWSLAVGKSAGIISTVRITHATPAAAYAHVPDRFWEKDSDIPDSCTGVKDIAYQLLKNNSNIHVMLGGGRGEFYNRRDNRNLPEEWLSEIRARRLNPQYVRNATELRAVSVEETDHLLGLFTESHMSYELSRDDRVEPSVAEMTSKAIEILRKNDRGFFLLVEGGQIDKAHHNNQAKRALAETVAMDDAVGVAQNLTGDDTLIVVTADHSHAFNMVGYPSRGNNILGLVDEINPGQEPTDGNPYTTLVYANGPGPGREQNLTLENTTTDTFQFQRAVPLPWSSETHTGEDVAIYAIGPMAHLFGGVHEQSYIAHVMAYASCVGPNTRHCQERPGDPCATGGAMGVVVESGRMVMTVTGMLVVFMLVWL